MLVLSREVGDRSCLQEEFLAYMGTDDDAAESEMHELLMYKMDGQPRATSLEL